MRVREHVVDVTTRAKSRETEAPAGESAYPNAAGACRCGLRADARRVPASSTYRNQVLLSIPRLLNTIAIAGRQSRKDLLRRRRLFQSSSPWAGGPHTLHGLMDTFRSAQRGAVDARKERREISACDAPDPVPMPQPQAYFRVHMVRDNADAASRAGRRGLRVNANTGAHERAPGSRCACAVTIIAMCLLALRVAADGNSNMCKDARDLQTDQGVTAAANGSALSCQELSDFLLSKVSGAPSSWASAESTMTCSAILLSSWSLPDGSGPATVLGHFNTFGATCCRTDEQVRAL